MKFDLVNPSDPYTMEADDLEIAAVAVCLLGNGKYALTGLDDAHGQNVPFFFLGGNDEWFISQVGMTYENTATRVLEQRTDALARAFESVTLQREQRSSLNDIGRKARDIAQAIRKQASELANTEVKA